MKYSWSVRVGLVRASFPGKASGEHLLHREVPARRQPKASHGGRPREGTRQPPLWSRPCSPRASLLAPQSPVSVTAVPADSSIVNDAPVPSQFA